VLTDSGFNHGLFITPNFKGEINRASTMGAVLKLEKGLFASNFFFNFSKLALKLASFIGHLTPPVFEVPWNYKLIGVPTPWL
jgi:hypothetical protein